MRRWIGVIAFAALLPVCMTVGQAAETPAEPMPPEAIEGFWEIDGGGAVIHIQVEDGPDGAQFPGRIAWLEDDHYPADDDQGMGGAPVVDRHNPDPSRRDQPMLGLQMIKDLDYHVTDNDRAEWADGRVYDSDRGRWFDCYIWLADANHLKLHGYIGFRPLGRTTTWTRVPDPADSPPYHPAGSHSRDRS